MIRWERIGNLSEDLGWLSGGTQTSIYFRFGTALEEKRALQREQVHV